MHIMSDRQKFWGAFWRKGAIWRSGAALGTVLAALATPANAGQHNPQQDLIDRARISLDSYAAEPGMGTMREMLGRASAVFIAPQIIKASFIVGLEGGSGVLLARNEQSQTWSAPSFYTIGGGSVGLQGGGEVSELILVVMTDRGLNAILKHQFKAGADASIAVGPLGRGVEAATTTNLGADIYSFSRSMGLFGGISVEGTIMQPRHSWNQSYFGRELTPREILEGAVPVDPGSDRLRQSLVAAAASE